MRECQTHTTRSLLQAFFNIYNVYVKEKSSGFRFTWALRTTFKTQIFVDTSVDWKKQHNSDWSYALASCCTSPLWNGSWCFFYNSLYPVWRQNAAGVTTSFITHVSLDTYNREPSLYGQNEWYWKRMISIWPLEAYIRLPLLWQPVILTPTWLRTSRHRTMDGGCD